MEKDEELTDEEGLEALEELKRREREAFASMSPAEQKRVRAALRKRKERRKPAKDLMVEHFDRTIARYTLDKMIALEATPLALLGAESAVRVDLDLWAEATGERLTSLTEFQRLGLEAWLWETHDRARNPDRWKPNKSSKHDAPWPLSPRWEWVACAVSPPEIKFRFNRPALITTPLRRSGDDGYWQLSGRARVPERWAPRRWFHPRNEFSRVIEQMLGVKTDAPKISVRRLLGLRAPLTMSITGAADRRQMLGEIGGDEDAIAFEQAQQIADADYAKAVEGLEGLSRRKHPNPGGFYGPKRGWWGPDTEPGCSLLGGPQPAAYCAEKDEPPPESELEQTHEPPSEPEFSRIIVGSFRLGKPPAWANSFYDLPGRTGGTARWKVGDGKPTGRRYWDQHVIDVVAGVRWPTKPRRPLAAQYTLDEIWEEPTSVGIHFVVLPFRKLIGHRLRSPYEPRGFPALFRRMDGAAGWAAVVPNRRAGAWARRYVEGRADELDAKRKCLEGPGRLLRSVWGEMRGGKPVGTKWKKGWAARGIGDDLDRLTVSAAIEAT